ncbi:MAG: mercuric ion transport protein [Gammaproteobacteria bacterium]|jgi:mercuric ion transport protein
MKFNLVACGIIGTVLTALCCFTPILVIFLSVVGFGAVIGYLDTILIPALIFFFGLTIFALWRRKKNVMLRM